ncbi:MAG: immunity 49 family protein [Candidatus Brocadia sp.]|nr:immunity 49 family protein [Candidatus Brocadia sp.]
MSTHFLPIYKKNAIVEIDEMMPTVVMGNVDLEYILRFCKLYRISGICSLFLEGRPQEFAKNLHKSGRAFLFFLQNSDMHVKVLSKAGPFFDSIASNDLDCAMEIAKNSRLTWNENEEYEDDFQYILFLMKHFFLKGTQNECEGIIRRYEEILDGELDSRLDICKGFVENDNKKFQTALRELIEEHEDRYQKLISDDAILPEEAVTEGKLYIEGLALLNLAKTKKFAIEDNYLFIPSTAKEKVEIAFSPTSWKDPYG